MSFLFGDSFGHYATAQLARKWSGAFGDATIVSGVGRNQGQALQVDSGYLLKLIPSESALVVGFALSPADLGTGGPAILLRLLDSGNEQVTLVLNHDGTLSLTQGGVVIPGGHSSLAINTTNWSYLELKLTIGTSVPAGSCQLQVTLPASPSAIWFTLPSGASTQATANASANGLILGEPGTNSFAPRLYGDFYLLNQSGAQNNGFLGNVTYAVLRPMTQGELTEWNPIPPPSPWKNAADHLVDDDVTFSHAGISGDIDLYQMASLPGAPAQVFAVQWNAQIRKDDAGSYALTSVLARNTIVYGPSFFVPGSSYGNYMDVFDFNPTTVEPWAPVDFELLQAGIRLYSAI